MSSDLTLGNELAVVTPCLNFFVCWLVGLVTVCVAAIIRRVLLVVLIGCGLGTALFFIGLETLFPKY